MAEPGGEGGDWKLAVMALTALVGIFGALILLVSRIPSKETEKAPEPSGAGGGQRRRGALDRMQRSAARSATANQEEDEDEDGPDGPDRAARRNQQKQHKKQERKEQQQAERQVRQQQETAKSEKQQKYEQKQKEKEAERLRKEEEEEKALALKKKKEQEEFEQWKEMFAVEAEGEEDSAANTENTMENFIDFIRIRKVVNLEDLAAEFRMRTSAAIDRLEQLEKMGRLSGIFDDRGKYVYITQQEMSAVADWLKKKGRINRADLVAACNRIIRLNPTAEDKARLEEEAKSAAAALEESAEGIAGEGAAVPS